MDNLINPAIEGYADQYFNLVQSALHQIREIVKAQQGRITLFAIRDTWDEYAGNVAIEVIDRSVPLIVDKGGVNLTMYPIDFFYNNGYISVLLVDEYGDYPRIYTDKMDDITVCALADFLAKFFEENK
jgi:hypothetical protein